MKKVLLLLLVIFSSLTLTACLDFSNKQDDTNDVTANPIDPQKVLLFIGDGMGENHIKTAEMYLEKTMAFSSFEKQGYVKTDSLSRYTATDSAAAATALATGQKTLNGSVATFVGNNLTSISELAAEKGLGVGIVTTDSLSGATPAGFSAHANNRNDEDDIIKSELANAFDLYLGAGYSSYVQYKDDFINAGYEFIDDYTQLKQTNKKVIGTFEKINNYTPSGKNPTLPILTEYAVKYMEENFPGGYFLMIEGAHIDKKSHSRLVFEMIEYLDEFNNSIIKAQESLKSTEDICFIVTADHETGKLALPNNKEEISNNLYKSDSHSSQNVNYYIELKNDILLNEAKETIDNTDIFKICKKLLGM